MEGQIEGVSCDATNFEILIDEYIGKVLQYFFFYKIMWDNFKKYNIRKYNIRWFIRIFVEDYRNLSNIFHFSDSIYKWNLTTFFS